MKKYFIVTESGTDLPVDLALSNNIKVLPMHVVMDETDYLDGSISVQEVFKYHDKTKKIPTTSAVNPAEYQRIIEDLLEEVPDGVILIISYSSKASCTYQNAEIAMDGMKNIFHIDSLNVSGGEAAIVLKAAEIIKNTPEIEPLDLIDQIEAYVKKARVSFIPGDLDYLRAGGRLSNASYLGAAILRIKPLIEIVDGKLLATKKYRGKMMNIAEQYTNEFLDRYNFEKNQLYFLFSQGLEESTKTLMESIAKEKGFQNITWIETGCVISSHGGPGAIGIAGFEVFDNPPI